MSCTTPISRRSWTPPTSGSVSAPASSGATTPPKARPPSTWPSRPRGAPSKPPASSPADIDLIVFGTTTPDLVFPNCGALLQARLGCTRRSGVQRRGGLQQLHLRAVDRRQVRPAGRSEARAGGGRRDALAHHRFHRSHHRDAVRRWRRRRGARRHRKSRASCRRTCTPMAATRTCCTAPAASRRATSRATNNRAVIRMAGREIFKVAVTMLGNSVDEVLAKNSLRQVRRSTGWCRTRPTSASSRPWRRSSTCRWSA